ncbi:hypothetical protein KUTeg_006210, partial [Tegillarca granosa]
MTEKKQIQEVIVRTERCKQIVKILERENVISLGAEGLKLGKEGALMLLTIANMKGDAFVFDVVFSCSSTSAVLKYQLNVNLRAVMDIQVAHIVIQENNGCRLPLTESLENICKIYSDKIEPIYKDKQQIKGLFLLICEKTNSAFWAIRPLTKEMIQYVVGDARALIPDVYTNVKKKLDELTLWSLFRRRVDEELMAEWSPVFRNMRSDRMRQATHDIIQDMEDKYESHALVDLEELSDEEKHAIELLPYSECKERSQVIKMLKNIQISEKLHDLEDDLEQVGNHFIPDDEMDEFLRDVKGHENQNIRKKAIKIHDDIKLIVLDDIGVKYGVDTPLSHLKEIERKTLSGLVYLQNYNAIVRSLATKAK